MKSIQYYTFMLPDRLYLPSNAEIQELVQLLAKSDLWSHQTTEILIPKDENEIVELNQKIEFFDKWWIEDYFYLKYKAIEDMRFLPSYYFNTLSGQEHMKIEEKRDNLLIQFDLGIETIECSLKQSISFNNLLEPLSSPYLYMKTELNTFQYFQDLKARTLHLALDAPYEGDPPRLELLRGFTYFEATETPNERDLEEDWRYPKIESWTKIREEYKQLFPCSYISRLPRYGLCGTVLSELL
jgi:hypothetical protein